MVNAEREALWRERMGQWRESGLSQRAYALANDLAPRQVGYWVRRLRDEVPPQTLLRVTVAAPAPAPAPATAIAPGLTLRSPAGWTVSLPAGLSSAALVELVRTLP